MFQVNDYVMYFPGGVCKVEDIGSSPIQSVDALTYTLSPLYTQNSKYYVPVDSCKLTRLLLPEEMRNLISEMPNIEPFANRPRSHEQMEFLNAYKSGDRTELIRLVKTLYLRKKDREAQKKTVSQMEANLLKDAETLLTGEIAFVLGLEMSETVSYVTNRIERLEPPMKAYA